MHEITLVRNTRGVCAATSAQQFAVSGRGVYNKHSMHVINAFTGQCCEEPLIHMHMSAQPTVIASVVYPASHPVTLVIEIGDTIRIDHRPYVLKARRYGDPILTPANLEAAVVSGTRPAGFAA
jgi:hypothetical protein